MARYVKDLVLNQPDDFVNFIVNDYLQKNQFVVSDWQGEPAYRAGDAMVEGYKYLKWSYANGVFHLEAWMKSTFGKEMDLEGFVGTLQKKPYKESLEQLFAALQQPVPSPQAAQAGQSSVQGDAGQQPRIIPVQTVDNTGAATMALVFGILGVGFSIFIPLVGIILGILGFSRARMGAGSSLAGRAKAGKILSIIAIVIAVVLWVLNVILSFATL